MSSPKAAFGNGSNKELVPQRLAFIEARTKGRTSEEMGRDISGHAVAY